MTIKEMEALTGMSRANIRFYESENLIAPRRKENGYRVYSESDAQTLLRIKLLRAMELPLDEVKALQAGQTTLHDALTQHLAVLTQKKAQLDRAQLLANELLQAGTAFDALDAMRYLQVLEGAQEVLRQDVQPRLNLPWRRFWARDLDYLACSTAMGILLRGFVMRGILQPILTLTAIVLLEPLCLSLFGTTLGKAVFGIRVTDVEGGRLRFDRGIERTWMVLWEGMALNMPFISWYFLYKNHQIADCGGELPWEQDSELTFRDDKMSRYALFAVLYLLLMALNVLTMGG